MFELSPWIMKFLMVLWKFEPWYPYPYVPSQRAAKFATVFGQVALKSPKTIRPMYSPPILMSKNALRSTIVGLAGAMEVVGAVVVVVVGVVVVGSVVVGCAAVVAGLCVDGFTGVSPLVNT